MRRPVAEASPLPGAPFRDPAILAAELDEIFLGGWFCIGHGAGIPRPGDVVVAELGSECALVARGADGRLRAFHNFCRHRGTRLLEGPASGLERIRCPYHAWCYGLDGRLESAPLMSRVEDFRPGDHGLVPVRLGRWEGLVFLDFSGQAPPVDEALAAVPDVSRYGIGGLQRGASRRYGVEANWKVVCENFGECYHCPGAHPHLNRVSPFQSGGRSFDGPGFCGGPMGLAEGCESMTMTGETPRPPLPGLDGADLRTVHYFNVYPTLLLALLPDYVVATTVWPLAPDRSDVVCEWLFPAEVAAAPGFDPADAVEFWDLTNRQDWELCRRVQQGVGSRAYRPGRYQAIEASVHAFDNWYLRRMGHLLVPGETETGGAADGAPGGPRQDRRNRRRNAPGGEPGGGV